MVRFLLILALALAAFTEPSELFAKSKSAKKKSKKTQTSEDGLAPTNSEEVYDLFNDTGNEQISNNLEAENNSAIEGNENESNFENNANANVASNSNANTNENITENENNNANVASNTANSENKDDDELDDNVTVVGKKRFFHPISATGWRTMEFILSSQLPKRSELEGCRKEVLAIGREAGNSDTMVSSIGAIVGAAQDHAELYHFCFYYSVMNLDLTLENDAINRSYVQKYQLFMDRMKAYWIMARALDSTFGTKKYFGYRRQRFIDLSQTHFGRHLQVLSPPLGDRGRSVPLLDPKAAIPYFSGY